MLASGALVMCWFGLYNRFPFVFPDTGAYIRTGFLGEVPIDRPLIYGLFLRHASLWQSLWLPIFVQAFLVSILIYLWVKYFSPGNNKKLTYWLAILLISFLTGVSKYVTFLMPDIFTAIMIMCSALLLFAPKMNSRDKIFSIVIFILSLTVHNSHLMITLGSIIVLAILEIFRKTRLVNSWKKLGLVTGCVITGGLLIGTTHYAFGGSFIVSQNGHIFMLTRLIDLQLAQSHLDKNCGKKAYILCPYKDQLDENFLWGAESPLYKLGGWSENEEEYKSLIGDILSDPKYLELAAIRSIEGGFVQFFHFDIENTEGMGPNTPPYDEIKRFYPYHIFEYEHSMQSRNWLGEQTRMLNTFQLFAVGISLCGLLALLFNSKSQSSRVWEKPLVIFLLIALYSNALVCGSLSAIMPRYQGRVVWLIPVLFFLLLLPRIPLLSRSSALK